VALDAEVRKHPREDDLVDAALAELKDKVVALRALRDLGIEIVTA
jgi:hypothetical protein